MTDNIHIPRISNTPPPIDDLNTSQYSIKSTLSSSSSSSSLNINMDAPIMKQISLIENTDKNIEEAKLETKTDDLSETNSNLDAINEPPIPALAQPIDSNQTDNDNQAAIDCLNENNCEIEIKTEMNLDNLVINKQLTDDSNKQNSENEETTKEVNASIPSFDELSNNQTTNEDLNNELFDDCGSINENIDDSAAICDNKIKEPIVTDEKLDKIIENYNLDSNKSEFETQINENKQEEKLDFFNDQNSHVPIDTSNEFSEWNAFDNKTETKFNDDWNAFESTNDDNKNTDDDGNWASFTQDIQQPTTQTTTEPDLFKKDDQNTGFANTTADDDDDWGDFASTNESTIPEPTPIVSKELPKMEETKQTSIASDIQASSSNNDVDLNSIEFDKQFVNLFKDSCFFEPDAADVSLNDKSNNGDNLSYSNDEIKDDWKKLLDINNSNCLNFKWRSSKLEELLYNSININRSTGNTDKTIKFSSTFEFSNDDDVLQPVKINELDKNMQQQQQSQSNKESENTLPITTNTDEKTFEAAPPSATTATFNFQDFDLDYLEKITTTEPTTSAITNKDNSTNSKPSQKSMLDDLLADIYPKIRDETHKSDRKPNESQTNKHESEPTMNFVARTLNVKLTQEALDLLDKLPDLSFMKSKVLMFPVIPSSDNTN